MTLNGSSASTDVGFTAAVSTLSCDLSSHDCCPGLEDLVVVSVDLAQSTDDLGVMLTDRVESSTNLPPPVLSDLAESFKERSDTAVDNVSAAPWVTVLGFSVSAHDVNHCCKFLHRIITNHINIVFSMVAV